MSLSGIITFILFALVLYYIGMIFWDMYKDSFINKDKDEMPEEEIDISTDVQPYDAQPILVEVEPDGKKQKKEIKRSSPFPFPWTADQINKAFEKIDLGEECKELENVVFMTKAQFKTAI